MHCWLIKINNESSDGFLEKSKVRHDDRCFDQERKCNKKETHNAPNPDGSQLDRLAKVLSVLREESDSSPTVFLPQVPPPGCVFILWAPLKQPSVKGTFSIFQDGNQNPKKKTEGAERLTKPASLGWGETRCILPFFFLSLLLWLQSPAEDRCFKDSDPSVSPIPAFMSPSSPQPSHSAFIKAGRESINSGALLKAVCPSVAVNSVLDIRNMSPLNSRCLNPATPDSDGCSHPGPGGGRQGTDWLICQIFTDKIKPSGCYLESCWGSIVKTNCQTRMLFGNAAWFFFSKLLLLYILLTGF